MNAEEYIAYLSDAAGPLDLPYKMTSSSSLFKDGMFLVCAWRNMDFRNLIENHECNFGVSITGTADFVMVDSLYNF